MPRKNSKKLRKFLTLFCCAALLVCMTIAGTVAYLTSQDTVTNTFTVGNVKITLDETDVDNSTPNKDRDQANSYKLLPGHEYTKDPIVHVDANSEDCYLFVKVANEIAAIEDSSNTVASQMEAKGWKAVDGQNGLYVYVGTAAGASAPLAVTKSTDVTVFEKIKVTGTVTNDTLADYANETITVTAYAVQKDGFDGQTAAQIWATAFPST